LQCLDKVIAYCGQIGLRIFLDRHSANADGYLNENVWFISGDPYYTEQRWMDDWVMLASRYSGNPTVIGADLFNEPKRTATWGNSSPLTDWNKAAERCASAIQAANPNWLIIVEGVEQSGGQSYWWGGNLMGAAVLPITLNVPNKLVYSIHDYPASVSAQPWFSAGNYPQNLGGVWDAYWGYLFKSNTAPVLVGEFGSKLLTTSDQLWMDKLTDYMDGDFDLNGTNDLAPGNKGISWTMWCFNPNSGDTGGIVGDDWTTVDQTKLSYIQASMAPLLASTGGGQTASFTVTLSSASSQSVSVAWSTASNTAIAGSDFTAASGTLTFAAGETSKTITVALLPNNNLSDTKAFTVQLSSPLNATLIGSSGIAAILPATAWHGWLSSHFVATQLTNPAITRPDADPDRDSTPNLLEYMTGLDPAKNDQTTTTVAKSASVLEFTYPKNKAATDVTSFVEWSDTLLNDWSTTGVSAPAVLSDNGITQQIKVTVPAGSGVMTRFVRLRVVKP